MSSASPSKCPEQEFKHMRVFSLGVTTFVQGLYTWMALIVLADVWSPTFNIEGFPDWTGMQTATYGVILFTGSIALGVVMHTMTRGLFRTGKDSWTVNVLTSDPVKRRIRALGPHRPSPGGPTYEEALEGDEHELRYNCFEFMHGVDSQLMLRAPQAFETVQVYRGQYRLARALVVPSVILALTLPFWDPARTLDGAGYIGPFPIIRTQLFLLSSLGAIVSFVAFRERAYRYAAAKVMMYVTMEGNDHPKD